jgi:hypothetical protein
LNDVKALVAITAVSPSVGTFEQLSEITLFGYGFSTTATTVTILFKHISGSTYTGIGTVVNANTITALMSNINADEEHEGDETMDAVGAYSVKYTDSDGLESDWFLGAFGIIATVNSQTPLLQDVDAAGHAVTNGVFVGDGAGLTGIDGANVTGSVPQADTAGTAADLYSYESDRDRLTVGHGDAGDGNLLLQINSDVDFEILDPTKGIIMHSATKTWRYVPDDTTGALVPTDITPP